jgi:hypothetical protein
VDDERIEGGPALGFVDRRHRPSVAGVGAEAVDGLGRKGDDGALAQQPGGRLDRAGLGGVATEGFRSGQMTTLAHDRGSGMIGRPSH